MDILQRAAKVDVTVVGWKAEGQLGRHKIERRQMVLHESSYHHRFVLEGTSVLYVQCAHQMGKSAVAHRKKHRLRGCMEGSQMLGVGGKQILYPSTLKGCPTTHSANQ